MADEKSKDTGADRLRKFRISLGLTQERMAEELGISESLYKGTERKKMPISRKTADAIESKFGVSADYFYFGTLREGQDVWTQVLECDDYDKFKIFMRLLNYFSAQGCFEMKEENIDKMIEMVLDNDKYK